MDKSHIQDVSAVCKELGVNPTTGLTQEEAAARLLKYGPNETPEPPKTPYWKLILNQFEDTLVRILLFSAMVSFVLALFEGHTHFTAFVEPFVILLILILNAVVGVWQESNAEAAIEALKSYASPHAVVLRDSVVSQIQARDLVPGDICVIAVGDQVPADLRLMELYSTTLRIDQSVLTGESAAVMKGIEKMDAKTDERWPHNLLFMGTSVAYGKGRGVVVLTGTKTEYGKIESSMREEEEVETPLKKKLDEFGEMLTKVIAVICILVWVVNIRYFPEHGGWVRGAIYYLKIAIALAVAAIPEGLPAVVTTCLALGTRKMAQKNALVRSLPAVETLGCTTVICSDKTGTLTTNMMSVAKVCFFDKGQLREADVSDTQFNVDKADTISIDGKPVSHPIGLYRAFEEIGKVCALCNDSSLTYDAKKKRVERVGEATEAALRVLTEKIGHPALNTHQGLAGLKDQERAMAVNNFWGGKYQKKATLEFTRDRKSMSVLAIDKDAKQQILFVKGAPENIIARCTKVRVGDNSEVDIDGKHRSVLNEKLHDFTTGSGALRCLGLAYTIINGDINKLGLENPDNFAKIESGLTFIGLVGMLDPPREEVKHSIVQCHNAGIRVIMITGDNKDTAEAIARRIGIIPEGEKAASFTGAEFDKLSDAQQEEAVRTARVFSRVDPTHKMKLVKLLQQSGAITAMTGDGVNDAPALKRADIGIAMGTGTEVAKAASKMVLSDDNFSTIVAAVEQGRAIYNNTKQFIRYLISSNIGEVVCIFVTAAFRLPEALVPVQLLWVNLVTDGLPATALGFNPPEPDIMQKRPRKPTEPIVNGWLFMRYLLVGIYVGLATVMGFGWWFMYYEGGPQMTWTDLRSSHTCKPGMTRPSSAPGHTYSCDAFHDNRPNTVALSVLVTIEMFNALNAVSEDMSILTVPPFKNIWLILAIALSFALHFMILYVPFFNSVFGVSPLGWEEWKGVLIFSFPVLVLDEILKFFSRVLHGTRKLKAE